MKKRNLRFLRCRSATNIVASHKLWRWSVHRASATRNHYCVIAERYPLRGVQPDNHRQRRRGPVHLVGEEWGTATQCCIEQQHDRSRHSLRHSRHCGSGTGIHLASDGLGWAQRLAGVQRFHPVRTGYACCFLAKPFIRPAARWDAQRLADNNPH